MTAGERIIAFAQRARADIGFPIKINILKCVIRSYTQYRGLCDNIRYQSAYHNCAHQSNAVFSCFFEQQKHKGNGGYRNYKILVAECRKELSHIG